MKYRLITITILLMVVLSVSPTPIFAQSPIVQAILFYSPTCEHCHFVIDEVLPPLFEKYKDQFVLVNIDVTEEEGQRLYLNTIASFEIPEHRRRVPTIVVEETVLVGSAEIPEILPQLIKTGLENNGAQWPNIPGLVEYLNSTGINTDTSQGLQQITTGSGSNSEFTFIDKFNQDVIGNTIAVIVLLGMIASAIIAGYSYVKGQKLKILNWPNWAVPVLAMIGLIAALYLTYVETTHSQAICGPVGDCNTVQESPYASLFGLIPVGIVGLVGYLFVLVVWILQKFGPSSLQNASVYSLWGMSWFGILFSIYLTFLEPFVIGATCAWCITSAIVMTLLLLATTGLALDTMGSNEHILEEWFDEEE